MTYSVDPKVLLHKNNDTPGVDSNPTAAADAILILDEVQAPMLAPQYAERNLAKGTFGHSEDIVVGVSMPISYRMELSGGGTAGVISKHDPVFLACGMDKKVLATAVTGTAQAGGADTIQLAVGASATDDQYRYLLLTITDGTGVGQERVIKSYVGATKTATVYEAWETEPDNTSEYEIEEQVAYFPVSAINKDCTEYFFYEGQRRKLLGAHGSVGVMLPAGALPYFQVEMLGLYGGISDQAIPDATLTGWLTPKGVNEEHTAMVRLFGYESPFYTFESMLNNQNVYRNIPGSEAVRYTDRQPGGTLEIETGALADFDWAAAVEASTKGVIMTTHGTTAGDRVTTCLTAAQLKDPSDGNQQGVGTKRFNLKCMENRGNDAMIVIFR